MGVKRLILVPVECGPHVASQKINAMVGLRSPVWVFFGRSYVEQRRWAASFDGVADRLSIAGRLQQVVAELKLPYLRLVAELGRKLQSDAWWASRIAERNTLISHLFLYCCYLRIARQLQEEHQGDLVVVAESWALLDILDDWARSGVAVEVRWLGRGWRGLECARYLVHAARQVIRLALDLIQSRLWGGDNAPIGQEVFLIHTYLEDTCFGSGHRFRERYFPGLAAWLGSQGHAVAMLPVISSSVGFSYRSIWKWLRRSDSRFINGHRHCSLGDYAHALAESWRSARLPFAGIELVSMDVTRLFVEEQRRTAFSSVSFLLYLRLPLRLRQHGIAVRELVVEHENMIAEKLLAIGFHRHSPETKILGYQHSGLYPSLLCSQIIPEEAAIAPLPDRVLCNGRFYLNILKDIGMPEHLLAEGPALRHTHLTQLRANDPGAADTNRVRNWDVLVVLPMMKSDAAELLLKILEALVRTAAHRVALKLHPMLSQAMLLREAELDQLPPSFSFVAGDLGQLLNEARVVVCMSSTAILEVAAAGVKMVVVGRESALDFNPLGFMVESAPPIVLVGELAEEIEKKLGIEAAPLEPGIWSEQCNIAELFNIDAESLMTRFIVD